MRVLISGGGTGGHVYPALAVTAQLAAAGQLHKTREEPEKLEPTFRVPSECAHESGQVTLLWIGSAGGMEQPLVERDGIAYAEVQTGQLNGIHPGRALVNAGKMCLGVKQSMEIVRSFQPDVCLATGGYVCAPVITACRMQRVPVLIYLPDMTPGWSIRLMSRLAQRVAVTFAGAADAFGGEAPKGKAVVTGYPVRQALVDAASDRAKARSLLANALGKHLGDSGETPLLLVFGGSQGARSINQAIWAALSAILPYAHVLHIVGTRDWQLYQQWKSQNPLGTRIGPEFQRRYHAVDYLHQEMIWALAAADLAVARAGASTLGEFPVAHLPSILVPLPFGGVNQQRNAEELAKHGAALVVDDDALDSTLADTIGSLLRDPAKLAAMGEAAGRLAQPNAAARIAQELCALARRREAA